MCLPSLALSSLLPRALNDELRESLRGRGSVSDGLSSAGLMENPPQKPSRTQSSERLFVRPFPPRGQAHTQGPLRLSASASSVPWTQKRSHRIPGARLAAPLQGSPSQDTQHQAPGKHGASASCPPVCPGALTIPRAVVTVSGDQGSAWVLSSVDPPVRKAQSGSPGPWGAVSYGCSEPAATENWGLWGRSQQENAHGHLPGGRTRKDSSGNQGG